MPRGRAVRSILFQWAHCLNNSLKPLSSYYHIKHMKIYPYYKIKNIKSHFLLDPSPITHIFSLPLKPKEDINLDMHNFFTLLLSFMNLWSIRKNFYVQLIWPFRVKFKRFLKRGCENQLTEYYLFHAKIRPSILEFTEQK